MKKIILSVCFVFSINLIFAVDNKNSYSDSVISYRDAITAFDEQDYGTALKCCENAILYRRQQIEDETEILKSSLSSKKVQTAGDDIKKILSILTERKEMKSVNIINSYLKKKGYDYFNNSMQEMLDYMNSSKVYPEAQKIIGDIYKLEGEYDFAEEYYSLALKNADVLDIPDERYDILYMLAEISRLNNDFPEMEKRLLNILIEDNSFKDNALNKAMISTIKNNKKGTMEKFFNLYRANSYISIDAYNQLAQYYFENGYKDKALQFSALSAITTFSKIIEIVESRNSEYSYTNLKTFMQEAAFYSDIVEWGSENQAWKSFNILAKYATECGYTIFSRELLVVLVQFSPETYWQKDAVLQLEYLN